MDDLDFTWVCAGASDKDLVRLLKWITKRDTLTGVLLELVPRDRLLDEINYQRDPYQYDQGMYQ